MEEQVPFPFESKQVIEPAVIEEPAYTNEEEEVENTDEPDFQSVKKQMKKTRRTKVPYFHHTTLVWIWKTTNSLVWIC